MRVAAVDLGKVRVGLAVSDELGLIAHPRPHLDGSNMERVVSELGRLAEEEGVTVFVVGLPLTLAGAEGTRAKHARKFAVRLAARTRARVELLDERLTTRQARDYLRAQGLSERAFRTRLDSASAAVLLQSWLDRSNPVAEAPAELRREGQ